MSRVRPHLTYANVMVTILAFIVLGGVAVAATTLPKNSVGNKQLKKNAVSEGKIRNNSVTGAKVKDGSLTGADINLATLGAVPQAEKAGTATSASTAQSATTAQSALTAGSAESANSADTATLAQNADNADNADELGGLPPSAYAPSSRFFYITVDPSSTSAEAVIDSPGVIQVATDGDSDTEHNLVVENRSGDPWVLVYPGPAAAEEKEHVLAPGGSFDFEPFPELTGLIMLQDREEPQKAVALQCGLTLIPLRITCFATLSPALSQ